MQENKLLLGFNQISSQLATIETLLYSLFLQKRFRENDRISFFFRALDEQRILF